MLIDKYRHIHIYENCSADMLSVNFSIIMSTHFLGDYKGAGAVSVPAKKCDFSGNGIHTYNQLYYINLFMGEINMFKLFLPVGFI